MESSIGSVDPVTFEILSHRLYQIAKEMGATLERVGGTVNTTQMHDYMASLYRINGDILSAGDSTGWHVACAGFAVRRILERFSGEGEIEPGDMFLLNDPYQAAIHQSDMYMISPIHYRGGLVAWSATFVHVADIGAMSPGGNSPGATEICHEGLRIPGLKLVERGKLRRDVFEMIVNMTRQPAMVGLDLKCEMAANHVARKRMEEMCGHYGVELVDAVSSEMIRYSETILRKRIQEIFDGSWSDSATIEAEETWKVSLRLEKKGDRLLFDFTGSDRQARKGINVPYHATFGACFGAVLTTLGYDIPKNQGILRPIEVIAPAGTVVNVQYPGPVSLNTTSGGTVVKYLASSVLMQMLATSEKWKNEVMALTKGGRFTRHAGVNQHGRYYVSSLHSIGASGARSTQDGIDTGSTGVTGHDVEWVELNFPLLYLLCRHIKDGGGAGKFRGGAGAEIAIMLHDAPERRIKGVALGVAGLRNSGQGIFGGYPGAPAIMVLHEDADPASFMIQAKQAVASPSPGGRARQLPYCEFDFKEGDVLYMRATSGGGYGDPLERSPESVLNDVLNGLVSPEAARGVYGVVLNEGSSALDLESTRESRAALRQERRV